MLEFGKNLPDISPPKLKILISEELGGNLTQARRFNTYGRLLDGLSPLGPGVGEILKRRFKAGLIDILQDMGSRAVSYYFGSKSPHG